MGEYEKMRQEIIELTSEVKQLRNELDAAQAKCRKQDDRIFELRGRMRFLEGQIEAYQYCMNCRIR